MIVGPLAGTLVYELHPGAPCVLVAILLGLCVLWPLRPVDASDLLLLAALGLFVLVWWLPATLVAPARWASPSTPTCRCPC